MRSWSNCLAVWLGKKIGLHPSSGELLGSLDGELTAAQGSRVQSHFARCATCQHEAELLKKGLQLFERLDATIQPARFSLERQLRQLQNMMTDRSPESLENQPTVNFERVLSPGLYERLVSELGIYVGSRSARILLQRCRDAGLEPRTLADAIEPLVTNFLGRETGSAVVTKVLLVWNRAHGAAAPSGFPS